MNKGILISKVVCLDGIFRKIYDGWNVVIFMSTQQESYTHVYASA